jgi:tetratricopeptide (TPR) repeat protein
MQKILLSFLLTGLLILCFSQEISPVDRNSQLPAYLAATAIYQQAEELVATAGDNESQLIKADDLYQQSLLAFNRILPSIERTGADSLVLLIKIKTGFIHYYFGNLAAAKKDYLAVLAIREKQSWIPDSLLFIPCLYTGGIYYDQDQFDSALFYYKIAEQINDAYPKPLPESQRLFNRLGAMHYETDNYQQARNYFEKAISLTNPADKDLLANYRINIGSLLIKLEEFGSAKTIFEELLSYPAFQNEINHNLGIISQKEKDFHKAIRYFRQVHYGESKKKIDLFYNFAVAFAGLGKQDSVAAFTAKALAENSNWNEQRKSIPHGLILKFQGDELLKKGLYKEAITNYQQAIVQFHYSYNDTAIRGNPSQFNGVYSFVNLFHAFVAKADGFEKWWQQEKDIGLLKTSLQTYQAAFALAGYVERTYNSDAARLFLSKIKYSVHSKPIDISLQLYELTHQQEWLESAYLFDQQNKASMLALTIRENELRFENASTNETVKKESSLKTDITRLSLKAVNTTAPAEQAAINATIGEKEIELAKLQEKLNDEPGWAQKRSLQKIPAVSQLQKKLDKETVLLSYHLSGTELVTLFISSAHFSYKKTAIGPSFFSEILALKNSLYNVTAQQRYAGSITASSLYTRLLGPFDNELGGKKRLIIIPDDELNYLPFEALQDENKKYLVEHFSVQYQYSTALFAKHKKTETAQKGNLSFAPFTSGNIKPPTDSIGILPASKDEISRLPGRIFIDKDATKENFLHFANHYSTIHLATHASVNNYDPHHSYIMFYPGTAEGNLYGQEIAGLRLDSTDLVILSACETGAGQLVKGEGLMSLSRAFAFAGCPNVITSLWKAEDKTTAFLTQRLHHYLDKNYTKDRALQLAKIDLLHDKEGDPRFRSPNYWAHLIFIGDYEPVASTGSRKWILIIAGLLALITCIIITKSLFARNKQARFS